MLRQRADREVLDDLVRARVDHVDGVAVAVRHVDARQRAARGAGQHVRAVVGVDVPCGVARDRAGRRAPAAWIARHVGDELAQRSARCPSAPRPPASRIRSPSATAARSERGAAARRPRGSAACAGRPRRSGPSACRARRRGRRSRRRRSPSAAAAACVVGAGQPPDPRHLAVAGEYSSTASLAVPARSEPPAITSRPPTAVTAA